MLVLQSEESEGRRGVWDRADPRRNHVWGFDERLGHAVAFGAFDRGEARRQIERHAMSIVRCAAKIEPLSDNHW